MSDTAAEAPFVADFDGIGVALSSVGHLFSLREIRWYARNLLPAIFVYEAIYILVAWGLTLVADRIDMSVGLHIAVQAILLQLYYLMIMGKSLAIAVPHSWSERREGALVGFDDRAIRMTTAWFRLNWPSALTTLIAAAILLITPPAAFLLSGASGLPDFLQVSDAASHWAFGSTFLFVLGLLLVLVLLILFPTLPGRAAAGQTATYAAARADGRGERVEIGLSLVIGMMLLILILVPVTALLYGLEFAIYGALAGDFEGTVGKFFRYISENGATLEGPWWSGIFLSVVYLVNAMIASTLTGAVSGRFYGLMFIGLSDRDKEGASE